MSTLWNFTAFKSNHYAEIKENTICPGSSDPFYIVANYIKWVTTPWTYSSIQFYIASAEKTYRMSRK